MLNYTPDQPKKDPPPKMSSNSSDVKFRRLDEKGGTEVEFDGRIYLFYRRNTSIVSVYQQVETRTKKVAWRLVWQPAHRKKVFRALKVFMAPNPTPASKAVDAN
ncbi:hypothetical protein ACMDCR_09220 [Labrys okinawensis]|uniref:hypothetical protein n=1 Tax=Labrys okinawensis TaxID=346911 RepID=UPI0039BD2E30